MDLTTEDYFTEALKALPQAPDYHVPTFGDDLAQFGRDLVTPGFGETGRSFRAAATSAVENDLSFGLSDRYVLARQYEPIVEAVNKVQGRQPRGWFGNGNSVPNPYSFGAIQPPPDYRAAHPGTLFTTDDAREYLWQQVEQERARNPGVFGQIPKDHEEVLADVQAEQRAAISYAGLTAQRGPLTGGLANFAGSMVGGFADPVNLATSVIGFPASESLLKTALIEGAGNAAATAATLPFRAQHYADIGEPMSAGDMASQVAGSAVFGAGIGVGGKLLGRLIGLHGHELVDEFQASHPDPTPGERTAAAMVEREANQNDANPFADTPEGRDLHRQAMDATQAALEDGRPDLVPDLSAEAERQALPPDDGQPLAEDGTPVNSPFAVEPVAHPPLEDNFTAPLSKYTPVLFRETSADRALEIIDPARNATNVGDLDFADHPDMALGQDGNRGILLSFRAEGVKGQVATQKPAWEAAWRSGAGEYKSRYVGQHALRKALTGVRVMDGVLASRSTDARLKLALEGLERQGWGRHEGDSFVEYRAPRARPLDVATPRAVPADDAAQADAVAAASHAEHRRNADPENLGRFTDPIRKPDAFRQQADDLARELAPPPETPPEATEAASPSPFGAAEAQIEALRRLDQDELMPDPDGHAPVTVKSVRAEIERRARAVERLRGCVEGDN